MADAREKEMEIDGELDHDFLVDHVSDQSADVSDDSHVDSHIKDVSDTDHESEDTESEIDGEKDYAALVEANSGDLPQPMEIDVVGRNADDRRLCDSAYVRSMRIWMQSGAGQFYTSAPSPGELNDRLSVLDHKKRLCTLLGLYAKTQNWLLGMCEQIAPLIKEWYPTRDIADSKECAATITECLAIGLDAEEYHIWINNVKPVMGVKPKRKSIVKKLCRWRSTLYDYIFGSKAKPKHKQKKVDVEDDAEESVVDVPVEEQLKHTQELQAIMLQVEAFEKEKDALKLQVEAFAKEGEAIKNERDAMMLQVAKDGEAMMLRVGALQKLSVDAIEQERAIYRAKARRPLRNYGRQPVLPKSRRRQLRTALV